MLARIQDPLGAGSEALARGVGLLAASGMGSGRVTRPMRKAPRKGADPTAEPLPGSYRRLAEVFCDVLAEQSLEPLRERIADALFDLVPYDALTIYELDEALDLALPVLTRRHPPAAGVPASSLRFGEGSTGQALERRRPVLVEQSEGSAGARPSPGEPAAQLSLPLIARSSLRGALELSRFGKGGCFREEEVELAARFGAAAALALDNAHLLARLEHEAQTDPLTGLPNRRFFLERLRAELARAARAADAATLLMLDIDDFKQVNDRHGHLRGDELLITLARRLEARVREADTACRLGGDEFAILMPSCTAEDGLGLARRLLRTLALLEVVPGEGLAVSIGICEWSESLDAEGLLAGADAAMLTAKARGRNQIALSRGEALPKRASG